MKIYIFWILLAISLSSCKVLENKDLIFEKHFGGVGDGKTDNYKAFLALSEYLNDKKNVNVIFNEGTYVVNTQTKGNVFSKINTSDLIKISNTKNHICPK